MSDVDTFAAPEFQWPPASDSKWESERQAFRMMRTSLMSRYRGQYVAVHEGEVVESGEDQAIVAIRAYERCGYVPIYVGLVSDERPLTVRMPSPRLLEKAGGQ